MNIKHFTSPAALFGIVLTTTLATLTVAPRASTSPATWVTDRIIGVSDGAWIALHVERNVKSGYEYRTRSEVRIIRVTNSCIHKRVSLGDVNNVDREATGNWQKSQISRGDGSNLAVLSTMAPVVPSDWRELITIENGSIALLEDKKKIPIIPSGTVLKWATLQGAKINSVSRIAAVFQSADTLRGNNWIYLEIETAERDVDVDYTRFVLPLKINPLPSGTNGPAELSAIQPQPDGC